MMFEPKNKLVETLTETVVHDKALRKLLLTMLLSGLYLIGQPLVAVERQLSEQNFEEFKSLFQGKNRVVILWSLDCPPCFKELGAVSNLRKVWVDNKVDFPVILLNTDDALQTAEDRKQVLREFELENMNSFYFKQDESDALKKQLDEHWFGELPRSYFVNKDDRWLARSGLVKASFIEAWLLK
jgi:thiol-disulfide isomerase/thioredoxin